MVESNILIEIREDRFKILHFYTAQGFSIRYKMLLMFQISE